jgi:hypothetical protein
MGTWDTVPTARFGKYAPGAHTPFGLHADWLLGKDDNPLAAALAPSAAGPTRLRATCYRLLDLEESQC